MLDLGTQAGKASHGGPRHSEKAPGGGDQVVPLTRSSRNGCPGRVGMGRGGCKWGVRCGDESIVRETVVTAAQLDKYTKSLHCAF